MPSPQEEVIRIASVKERTAVFQMNAVMPQSRRNTALQKEEHALRSKPRRRKSGLAPDTAWKNQATADFFATDWQVEEWQAFESHTTPAEKTAQETTARENLQSVLSKELGKPIQTTTYNGARVHYVQAVSTLRPPVEDYHIPLSDSTHGTPLNSADTDRHTLRQQRRETLHVKQRYNTLKGAWDKYDVVAQDKLGHVDDDDDFLQQQWDMQQELDEVEVELAQEWCEFVDQMKETQEEFELVHGEPEKETNKENNDADNDTDNDNDQQWIQEARSIQQNHQALSKRQSRRRQWRAKIEQRQKDVSVSRLNVEPDSDDSQNNNSNNHHNSNDDSNDALQDSFMEHNSDDERAPRIIGGEIQADFVAPPTQTTVNSDDEDASDDDDQDDDDTNHEDVSTSHHSHTIEELAATSQKAASMRHKKPKKKKSKRHLQGEEESTSSMNVNDLNNDSSSTLPSSSKGKKKKSKKKTSSSKSSSKNNLQNFHDSDNKFHRPPSKVASKSDDEASDDDNDQSNIWKIGEGHLFKAWMHQPRKVKIDGGKITIKVPEKTDCWRKTRHNWVMDNAPFCWHKMSGDFEVMVHVSGTLSKVYDKAGIMIRVDPENWIVSAAELFHGSYNHSTCWTRNHTDWSLCPLKDSVKANGIWLCAKKIGPNYETYHSYDGQEWVQTRQGLFDVGDEAVRVGIFCACPMGQSYSVSFDHYKCQNIK